MKTPEEIKKGLAHCSGDAETCDGCPYRKEGDYEDSCVDSSHADALAYITQLEADKAAWEDVAASPGAVEDMAMENYRLESTYSQVSKALCGRENAALDEVLQAVSQLKTTLEMAQGERDAINKDRIDLMTRLAQAERESDDLSLKNLFLKTSLESVTKEYTAVKRERDAAVADLSNSCQYCKFASTAVDEAQCASCIKPKNAWLFSPRVRTKFEWRGVCKENSKEEKTC